MNYLIDLVICTYNNATYLDKVLTAIAKQQVSVNINWGVLVVDNNCTDNTQLVVQKHIDSGQISNLRIVTEPMQGLNNARHCGVKNTFGNWVAFVDDDCILDTDWIEQAGRFALANPQCGAFGGRVILDWEIKPPSYMLKYGYSFAQQEYGETSKQMSCLVGAGMVIRRHSLLEIGWMDKQFMSDRVGSKLISGGDVELALRIGSIYELWYNPYCKLNHLIPLRRMSPKYLMRINYGLGISQIYGDAMLWAGSYTKWFFVSIFDTITPSALALLNALKVIIGRRSAPDIAISTSFIVGRWVGIWRMLWMNIHERNSLLGCAKLA